MEASPPGYTIGAMDAGRGQVDRQHDPAGRARQSQDSGLVDHLGRPLYRKPARRLPVGFLHPYPARS